MGNIVYSFYNKLNNIYYIIRRLVIMVKSKVSNFSSQNALPTYMIFFQTS